MVGATSAAEALALLPAGARVVATPGCAAPTTLLAALAVRAREQPGMHLYSGLQLDASPFHAAVAAGSLRLHTWHVTADVRDLVADGRAAYLPLRLSDVPATLERLSPDAALVRVSPPDTDGQVSLGPSMSYSRAAVDHATHVIAEVDPHLPRTRGPTRLPVSRIAAFVRSQHPTPRYRSAVTDPVAARIAERVVDLLPTRPTLQVGIGQVPEAVVAALARRRVGQLRLIGLCVEGVVDLAEAGLLDEEHRAVAPIAAVEVMGGERLMRFADDNPLLTVHPSTEGHSPAWLAARFARIVSVNGALQVDLLGQVNAEVLRGEQVSGVGGSADFVDAARATPGGLSVVALRSTTSDGATSRIVARLDADAVTTIPRHAYDLVVTEHGVADLRGRSVADRAAALLAIAAPAHRAALHAATTASAGPPSSAH